MLMQMGGGLRDYQRSGQLDNLLRYHFPGYLLAFDRISFFSYGDERIEDFTDDPELRARVTVWPKRACMPDKLYAALLPWIHGDAMRRCSVLRVLQATGALPAIGARLLYGVPYVTTFGYRYAEFARLESSAVKAVAVSALERLAVRWADAVIVTTPSMREHVEELGRDRRVVTIPNGIDVEVFRPPEPDRRVADRTDGQTVLFVGRLETQKNLRVLVEALAIVRRRRPIMLVVVGDGSLRGDLARHAAAIGVPVTFAGVVPNGELPLYYQQADVFVLPSLAEGHPKVLLEAMSCGTACVVSSCDGNRSLVKAGVTALTHEPSDVAGLAEAIERVLANPALQAGLGRRAREHVITRFSIEESLRATCALLQDVAARRGTV